MNQCRHGTCWTTVVENTIGFRCDCPPDRTGIHCESESIITDPRQSLNCWIAGCGFNADFCRSLTGEIETCGTITPLKAVPDQTKFIVSPGFLAGNPYPFNSNCTWEIEVSLSSIILAVSLSESTKYCAQKLRVALFRRRTRWTDCGSSS